jgi:hypothetical protein
MGIPYLKEIHFAFDQVTPLAACGFGVLEIIRNISILVTVIQIIVCILLTLVLLSLLGLLITLNPDLEPERRAIVTPIVRWLAAWIKNSEDRKWLGIVVLIMLGGVVFGTWAGCSSTRDSDLVVQDGSGDEAMDEILGDTGM